MVKPDAVNVLLVDDQPGKLLSYEVMLEELGENLISTSSAKEALAYLLKSEVAVILVDVCMPELDGFELAQMIREHPRFQKTAIIFISAIHMSETDYLRGYQAGAVDYLSVPVVPELLRAKVRVFAELFRKTRELHLLNEELERRVAERTEALNASTEQLRKSEEARSLALASGHMGSWDWEVEGGTWFWDEGQSRIFGVEHDGFAPSVEKIRKFIHSDDLPAFTRAIDSLSRDTPSFDIEVKILRPNGDLRWCRLVAASQLNAKGMLLRLSGVTADITDRKEAENKQALLAREVDHRAKNALAVVQAIVRLAKRDNIQEFIIGVEGRINALAQTHELLSRSRWEGADVLRLVLEELAPYQGEKPQRVSAIGPSVMVSPENAQTVAIALHELATNAAKYGALSQPGGRVDVSWSSFEGTLALTWKEAGGPAVAPPTTRGFGTKIITASLADPRRGKVAFDWRPDGLICSIELNMMAPQASAPGVPAPVREASPTPQPRLLLVEDEVLVGLFMGEMLEDMDFSVTDPCRTLADGLAAAKAEKFDGAVLDMNLNGESVYPLADLLTSLDVPFIFVTGYSADVVAERFAKIPIIQKPVAAETLAKILRLHLAKSPAIQPSGDTVVAFAQAR
ncbi:MAG TPA: response regulator [Rhizomicrobium sp.]|nr:response regulator [Rhizomicrobium sp.]